MDNIIQTAKDKIAEITDNVQSLWKKDVVESLQAYGIDKVQEVWAQLEAATEVFKQTGYSITAIDVNVALPPTIVLSMNQIENISDEQEAAILEENKDRTFIYPLLVALFKANAIQKSINAVQYKFSGLSIGVGITPSIDMKFKRVEGA
jgi:hypothetical protein